MIFYNKGMTNVLLVIPVFFEVTVSCYESKEFLWVEMGSYEFLWVKKSSYEFYESLWGALSLS